VYNGVLDGERVAIKKLRINVMDPNEYFLDLEQEVQLLAELDHPNILGFVGVCVWPSYYILTEFMEGGTLSHALYRDSTELSWAVKQHILLQIAAALHYLHYLLPAIIHLDIKPLNILMGPRSGDNWIAKLSDFGLSVKKKSVVRTKKVEEQIKGFRALNEVTPSGRIPTFLPAKSSPVGTPLHVAPEIANKMPFNEKADIYSFGMLIWEVIHRKRLHRICENADLHTQFVPEIDENVPKALQDLMQACWKINQWERPSISSVLDILNDFPEDNFDLKNK
jgi:serine/threonine protein kinase